MGVSWLFGDIKTSALESSLLTFVFKVSGLFGFSGILFNSFIDSGSGIGSVIGLISCS